MRYCEHTVKQGYEIWILENFLLKNGLTHMALFLDATLDIACVFQRT